MPKYEVVKKGKHYTGITKDGGTMFMEDVEKELTELREERDYQQRKIDRLILELTEAEQERDHWKAVAAKTK